MTRTYIIIGLLLISSVPYTAKSDLIFDPNTPLNPPASTTPGESSTPIDWVSETEWGCDEGFKGDGTPYTRCGLGRYRRLCSIQNSVPDCDVFFELQEPPVISNVLFLPGIKGSRLYRSDRQLWEPSRSSDIAKLSMNEQGRSLDPYIHARAGDLLSETFGHEFYTSFFEDLNSYKEDGSFGESWTWEAAAYDWRLSLSNIVNSGARTDDRIFYSQRSDTPYIEQLLWELAAFSPTGKVTIIAHSNGGLVAKALMQRLGDGAGNLVDKIIFVGVPQSGAPRALAAALFGYGEALPFDSCANWVGARLLCALLVDRETARLFAEHSPMTYHLLPSDAYFNATNNDGHPPISFSSTTLYVNERERYGETIDTASELYEYSIAAENGRTKPASDDLKNPNVLSSFLINYARDVHTTLDAWTPPAGVRVYQLAGWGKDTLSGIQFYEKSGMLGPFGKKEAMYRPTFMEDGDGIVPTKSALMRDDDSYWIDLTHTDESHADLLEISDVRTYIRNILTESEESLPALISTSTPDSGDRRKIMFFLHSPLTLGLFDEEERYTGLEKNGVVSMNAPDVEYGEFGEVKYLIAPAGNSYEIVMHGLAYGTSTLEVLERVGNEVATTSSIVDVPVTPTTVATLSVSKMTGDIPDLHVDVEGDGTIDLFVPPEVEGVVIEDKEDVPEVPDTPTEPQPAPDLEPEPSNSKRISSRIPPNEESEEELQQIEEVLDAGTTTSSPVAAAYETETHVSVSKPEEIASTTSPRTQTASVHDAFARKPHNLLIGLGLTSLLLLVVLLLKRKTRLQ